MTWAPVNCGATKVATDLSQYYKRNIDLTKEEIADITAQCGYYYQWGRNVPFQFGIRYQAVQGIKPTYAEACRNEGSLANRYAIYLTDVGFWFTDYNNPLSPLLAKKIWPRIADPCPAGWRIPTEQESTLLADKLKNAQCTNYVITLDNFSIPIAGHSGTDEYLLTFKMGENGCYWTSYYEPGEKSIQSNRYLKLYTTLNNISVGTGLYNVSSCNIRCVLENHP